MTKPMKMLFFLFLFLVAKESFANNPGVSYQGRIFKPDGNALEGTAVQFRMQVRSPGSENCLLFEEVQTLNMAGSSGIFSITMNDGTGTRLDAATYQVDRIFANRDVMTLDASRCAVGTSYTPNVADGRKLIVYFKDETMAAYEAMPIMNLNYVPQAMYALESQKVGTFAATNILRAVDGSGNPVVAPALDPTQLTNLANLLAGTSTQYATTTAFNTVQTFAKSAPPSCGAGEVLKSNGTSLSCVTDSTGGAPAYSAITGATGTNSIDNTNFAQTWNWSTATTQIPMSMNANALTTGSLMSVATSSASLNSTNGLINVANTGASTTGTLARFQSNSTAGSGLTVLTNGNVGIGTASPAHPLHVAGKTAQIGDGFFEMDASDNDLNVGIGNDLGASNGSVVFGRSNTSNWDNSVTFGTSNTVTTGFTSMAIGRSNVVNVSNATAIGSGITNSTAGSFMFGPSDATKITILSSGNVGVGTSAPVSLLHVSNPSVGASRLSITNQGSAPNNANGVSGIDFYAFYSSSSYRQNAIESQVVSNSSNGAADLVFKGKTAATDNALTEFMRIATGGNVGIGTVSPTAALTINGDTHFTNDSNRTISVRPTSGVTVGRNLTISSGATSGTLAAGALNLVGGDASSGTSGGNINITAGFGFATGGDVTISGGQNDLSVYSDIKIAPSGGNVGIGTISPLFRLDVEANVVNDTVRIKNSNVSGYTTINFTDNLGTQKAYVGRANSSASQHPGKFVIASDGEDILFESSTTGTLPRMTIESSGDVGIGTTGPTTKLHVVGSSGATIATFADGGATTCTVTPASTGFACSSDERLKKNIESFSDATSLENILQLRTVTYDWRSVDNGRHTGYIAQELEQVAPEFVRTGEDGFKQVNYTGLVPWITGAIKAFYAEFKTADESKSREIASLQAENKNMKQENSELKARLDHQEKELAAIKNKLGL